MIGKPAMLPLWFHGFFSKVPSQSSDYEISEVVKLYLQKGYPLEGIVIPPDAVIN